MIHLDLARAHIAMRLEEATAILEGLLETATTPAERADLRRVIELMDS